MVNLLVLGLGSMQPSLNQSVPLEHRFRIDKMPGKPLRRVRQPSGKTDQLSEVKDRKREKFPRFRFNSLLIHIEVPLAHLA
jgi:hypothetical protein